MAALLIRLLYALFPNVDWQFVYVDDFIWILRADSAIKMSIAILATLAAIGLPIAWHKTALLQINSWLGFTIDSLFHQRNCQNYALFCHGSNVARP